ncbi:DUF1217 domain-containing protein [Lentilitoribacter sp. Alg239-R112]|uniref:DUF1217 domain-containing protein n=1 Tax=Lentilitoribacter sp. Alg239-R112 TaxID=2305987 RepID=UPI0013A6A7AD|nr:DUF1217 domain-containing protein [Lentilitoribacter sp. Alg239-R112]
MAGFFCESDLDMISSLESYNFYTRDKIATYNRIAGDSIISREAAYYNETIKTINTVEEFMDDDRLYNYAMKAYGLEEMTYAKGLIKKVLESNLTDSDSFANRLDDVRYKELAAAFDFGITAKSKTVQTEQQRDDLIGTYTASIQNINKNIQEEHRYYNVVMSQITNVDDIFKYPRIRDYIFEGYGIDPSTFDYETTKQVLSSDPTDTESYVYKEFVEKSVTWNNALTDSYAERSALIAKLNADRQTNSVDPADVTRLGKVDYQIAQYNLYIDKADKYIAMSAQFNFQSDGSIAANASAQNEDQLKEVKEKYVLAQPRLTYSTALINKTYYEDKMATIDDLNDLIYDRRLRTIMLNSFDITLLYKDSDLRTAFSQYATDPTGADFLAQPEKIQNLVKSYNFDVDGNVIAGKTAQDPADVTTTTNGYLTRYNSSDAEKDASLISEFKRNMPLAADLDDFLSDLQAAKRVRGFALTAFGIGENELTRRELKAVFTSDLGDPKSFVNKSGDDRLRQLAKAFNFDAKGNITTPRSAQSENELTRITKAYYVELTRFDSTKSTKEKVDEDVKYYREEIAKIDTLDDLVKNQKLIDFLAKSERLKPDELKPEFLKKLLMSDQNDPKSFLNQQTDVRYKKIFGSFNFNENGSVASTKTNGVQNNRGLAETQNFYITQSIEEEAGVDSVGARLALYFERKAPTISSLYEILADKALGDFVRTALSIPAETASGSLDSQKALMERYIKAEDLQKPEKIRELVTKFLALHDIENGAPDPILGVFNGSTSFSAEALASFAQYRAR